MMNRRVMSACALLLLSLAAAPVHAQTADSTDVAESTLVAHPATDPDPAVTQYYLDGPRVGVTFMSHGEPRTQFGWHAENQASPGTRGPWFLVERIILIGGVERSEFIPTGSVIFGVRTPDSFEFGVGPSLSISSLGFSTAVVVAAGRTLRYGGVRVPLNLAVAMSQRENQTAYRVTLISGWAIKQSDASREAARTRPRRPYRFGLEG